MNKNSSAASKESSEDVGVSFRSCATWLEKAPSSEWNTADPTLGSLGFRSATSGPLFSLGSEAGCSGTLWPHELQARVRSAEGARLPAAGLRLRGGAGAREHLRAAGRGCAPWAAAAGLLSPRTAPRWRVGGSGVFVRLGVLSRGHPSIGAGRPGRCPAVKCAGGGLAVATAPGTPVPQARHLHHLCPRSVKLQKTRVGQESGRVGAANSSCEGAACGGSVARDAPGGCPGPSAHPSWLLQTQVSDSCPRVPIRQETGAERG
ncbi:hypothetical protein LEMLEM_LOCUS21012 [Lemmus lemmus]